VLYVAIALLTGHFATNLLPTRGQLTRHAIARVIGDHLRFKRSTEEELATYNILQRLSYSTVVFILFPLMIWTGRCATPPKGRAPTRLQKLEVPHQDHCR
jgi:thiosulfate reductase cytochrome b subunit